MSSMLEPIPGSHVLTVQETNFTCGGLAICAFFSHKIADASTASFFLKAWAAATSAVTNKCKEKEMLVDCEGLSAIFPQNESFRRKVNIGVILNYFDMVTNARDSVRRFVFDESSIARLKDEVAASMGTNNVVPTRAEAVSALLWKRIISISQAKSSAIGIAINLRKKVIPPIPESSLGNVVWTTYAFCTEQNPSLASLVYILRESTSKIDSDFVKNLQSAEGLIKLHEVFNKMTDLLATHSDSINGKLGNIMSTSWCNFGFYEVDFVWGKPTRMTHVISDYSGAAIKSVILSDTGADKRVKALVYLDKEELIMLEHDKEFLAYASIAPNSMTECNVSESL